MNDMSAVHSSPKINIPGPDTITRWVREQYNFKLDFECKSSQKATIGSIQTYVWTSPTWNRS
jgi:hypothetical protein